MLVTHFEEPLEFRHMTMRLGFCFCLSYVFLPAKYTRSLIAPFEIRCTRGARARRTRMRCPMVGPAFPITASEYESWIKLREILRLWRPPAACIWVIRLANWCDGTRRGVALYVGAGSHWWTFIPRVALRANKKLCSMFCSIERM